jgi:uncharacterized protein YqeY
VSWPSNQPSSKREKKKKTIGLRETGKSAMLDPVLVDDIKKQVTVAMKSGDAVARDVLRLALGEIQMAEARKNAPASEEEAVAAVRKLIKSNEETLGLAGEGENATTLRREIEILSALLPKQLSMDDIVAALAGEQDAIKAAKSDGQATGVAMKHLKTTGAAVSGNDVGAAVKKIRGSQ